MPKANIGSYPTIIYRGKSTALLFSQAYFEVRERKQSSPASDNSDFCT